MNDESTKIGADLDLFNVRPKQINLMITIKSSFKAGTIRSILDINNVTYIRFNLSKEKNMEVLSSKINYLKKYKPNIKVLLDLGGMKKRIKLNCPSMVLKKDQKVNLKKISDSNASSNDIYLDEETFNYISLNSSDTVFISDGWQQLKIIHKTTNTIECVTLFDCEIFDNRGISVEGLYDNIKQNYNDDLAKIHFLATQCSFEYVGISFCNKADIIKQLRHKLGDTYKLMAKIETVSGIKNLSGIVSTADAIMVARGDLFVEIAYQGYSPLMTERAIISYCNALKKEVVIGTRVADSLETDDKLDISEYLFLKDEIAFTGNELNYMLANETSFDENKAVLNINKVLRALETLCKFNN